jgi:hypothetical protein
MEVGDIIRWRQAWTHDEKGNVVQPRPDNAGWSDPMLVIKAYPGCDGVFIVMKGTSQIALSGPDECYDIEILQSVSDVK